MDTFDPQQPDSVPSVAATHFSGRIVPMWKLALVTSLWTVLTLGIYRFWARTRVRNYIWSSSHLDSDAFEYTGNGLEKFLGFLYAVVVLAVYLSLFQIFLSFFGFSLIGDLMDTTPQDDGLNFKFGALQLSISFVTLFVLLPAILFAQYRAARYKLSRTRWRGIRFGLERAAWGYVWRGMILWAVTALTIGLLYPLMRFKLEKYKTDRMWFGSAKFEQGGKWTMLYGPLKHILFGYLLFFASIVGAIVIGPVALLGLVVALIWVFIGFAYNRAHSHNRLTRNKVVDGGIMFNANAQTAEVVKAYLLGALMVIVVSVIYLLTVYVVLSAMGLVDLRVAFFDAIGDEAAVVDTFALRAAVVVLYVAFLLIISSTWLAFATLKITQHLINSTAVLGKDHFDTILQRNEDDMADADGFADALDLGGAF